MNMLLGVMQILISKVDHLTPLTGIITAQIEAATEINARYST